MFVYKQTTPARHKTLESKKKKQYYFIIKRPPNRFGLERRSLVVSPPAECHFAVVAICPRLEDLARIIRTSVSALRTYTKFIYYVQITKTKSFRPQKLVAQLS